MNFILFVPKTSTTPRICLTNISKRFKKNLNSCNVDGGDVDDDGGGCNGKELLSWCGPFSVAICYLHLHLQSITWYQIVANVY